MCGNPRCVLTYVFFYALTCFFGNFRKSLGPRGTNFLQRKDISRVKRCLVDTGEFAVLLCYTRSDWSMQTRNIFLHVLAALIGYVRPALHQAVALDGNKININI